MRKITVVMLAIAAIVIVGCKKEEEEKESNVRFEKESISIYPRFTGGDSIDIKIINEKNR